MSDVARSDYAVAVTIRDEIFCVLRERITLAEAERLAEDVEVIVLPPGHAGHTPHAARERLNRDSS